MSKLTQEQKAEAYEKALEKARDALKDGTISQNTIAYLQDIFPELKESEDEKMRKRLIAHFKNLSDAYSLEPLEINPKKAIAWLEKQGKQKSTDKIDDVVNFSDDEKCLDEDLEKRLDEPKSKFKIGDWVIFISTGNKYRVEKIENYEYVLRNTLGNPFCIPFSNEELIRKWTIQDAKDGDVIITKNKNIFIFKLIRDCTIYDHCGLYSGKFIEFSAAVNGRLAAKLPTNYAPATKEQRDTLMKAMTDAGYAFDFEKKELKKIEQKYEPKFKVGDWIIFNNNSDARRVEEIEDGVYTLRNSIGGKMVLSSVLDKLIRHWTIKDAEDGDILVIAENGEPFIFKGCSDTSHPDEPVAYCGIVYGDDFHISPNDKWWTSAKVLPATKEQRNILFEKMKKAGYEWDAVKKKLKKIKK